MKYGLEEEHVFYQHLFNRSHRKILIEFINDEKVEVYFVISLNLGDAKVLMHHLIKEVPLSCLVNSRLVNRDKIKKSLSLISFLSSRR